jgi:hypothetical protein
MSATALSDSLLGCTRGNLSNGLNTGPSVMRAVSSQAYSERTGQVCSAEP